MQYTAGRAVGRTIASGPRVPILPIVPDIPSTCSLPKADSKS